MYKKREYMKLNERQSKIVNHQLELLRLREKKQFKFDPDNPFNLELWDNIEKKIPEKALVALEKAFEAGFKFMFEKGNSMINKTGNFPELKRKGLSNVRTVRKRLTDESLRAISGSVNKKTMNAKTLSTVEGAALGIFGIGLPDIPVFLGVLFKAIYEIACCYGFDYDTDEERAYALAIMRLAAAPDDEKDEYSQACDELSDLIDTGRCPDDIVNDDVVKETSDLMSTAMLVAKFIQGITIVGSIGAAFNYSWMKKISAIADIKYKERFFRELMNPNSRFDTNDLMPPKE